MTGEAMRLPDGKTCGDCAHFSRCSWLVGATREWTSCDWDPSRFQPRTDWFGTATGRLVYAWSPDPAAITIEDIGLALARQCRFGGHIRRDLEHYSVAQHSVHVSSQCHREHALIGLLHDAAEAYVQDVIRPIKHSLGPEYGRAETLWARAIGERFGLGESLVELPEGVRHADEVLLATERRDVVDHRDRPWRLSAEPLKERITPVPAFAAYGMFMGAFYALTDG